MFQKQKQTTDELLKKESSDIHNIFQDTATRLINVNEKIQVEREAKKAKIEALMNADKDLEDTQIKNEKFANKINSFLND